MLNIKPVSLDLHNKLLGKCPNIWSKMLKDVESHGTIRKKLPTEQIQVSLLSDFGLRATWKKQHLHHPVFFG